MTHKRAIELLRSTSFTLLILIAIYIFSGADYAQRAANLRDLRWGLLGELVPNGEKTWEWRWGLEDHDDIGGRTQNVAYSFADYILNEKMHDYDFMFSTESPPYGMIWGALRIEKWHEQGSHGFLQPGTRRPLWEVEVSGYLEITRKDLEEFRIELTGFIPVDPPDSPIRKAQPTWGLWSIKGESLERKIMPSVYAARRAARDLELPQHVELLHSSEYLILGLDFTASARYRIPVIGVELPFNWALLATSLIAFGVTILYSVASRSAFLQSQNGMNGEWALITRPRAQRGFLIDRVSAAIELFTLRSTLIVLVLSPQAILAINAFMLHKLTDCRWHFYIVSVLMVLNLVPAITAAHYLRNLVKRMSARAETERE